MGVNLLFENNVIGTHTYTVESTASATVIQLGRAFRFPNSQFSEEPDQES